MAHLFDAQHLDLDKIRALIGIQQNSDPIASQSPEVLSARLEAFLRFGATLIRQVHDYVASAMPTHYTR